MTDLPEQAANVEAVPAADVAAPPPEAGSVVHRAYPLRKPEEDANDIVVEVRGSTLRKVRARLDSITTRPKVPWTDLSLGAATLFLGGALGAIASDLPWAVMKEGEVTVPLKAVIFYVLLPVLGFGSGVAHVILRHTRGKEVAYIAEDILEYLPHPDRTL